MQQRGFSLIELLVVIAIIAIMAAMAIPMITQILAKQDIDGAARNLAADIRWVQQVSVNGGSGAGATAYTLMFDNGTRANYYITANGQTIKSVQLPGSVKLVGSTAVITFNPSTGFPGSGAQSISLQSTKLGSYKYVILAPVTGRVRISDTNASQ